MDAVVVEAVWLREVLQQRVLRQRKLELGIGAHRSPGATRAPGAVAGDARPGTDHAVGSCTAVLDADTGDAVHRGALRVVVPRRRVAGARARGARPGADVPLVVAHADAAGSVAARFAPAVVAGEAGSGARVFAGVAGRARVTRPGADHAVPLAVLLLSG